MYQGNYVCYFCDSSKDFSLLHFQFISICNVELILFKAQCVMRR